MPHYAYRVHNEPGQILSQVPEDINRTLKEDTFKESAGCKKNKTSLGSKGTKGSSRLKPYSSSSKQNTKTGTKTGTKKITSLDELRMKYSK